MEGFDAMGHPIPADRQQAAYDTAKSMGIESPEDRTELVGAMTIHLENDRPFEAQEAGLKFLDITGFYRLMAVLLTPPATPSYDAKTKGDWVFERSSGYAGYRCRTCATWIYANTEYKCKCDGTS